MGLAQDVLKLAKYIAAVKNNSAFKFEFAAYGKCKDMFFAEIEHKQIHNVHDAGFMDQSIYDKFISRADMAIVSVSSKIAGLASPSKFCSYISLGIPVLFIGPDSMEVAKDIIKYNAGIVISNTNELNKQLLSIYNNQTQLTTMGKGAEKLFIDKYTLDKCVTKYIDVIKSLSKDSL
ncbi:hypothetical protein IPL68_07410 [Candidatus Saccharibacteria bacterium]|nr:MAG: hypothetical protein IPL68_07410 [Candidatus Saccharibacteria bacterium]